MKQVSEVSFLPLLPTMLRDWTITAVYLAAVNWVIELI